MDCDVERRASRAPGNAQYDLLIIAGDPEVYVRGRHLVDPGCVAGRAGTCSWSLQLHV